MVGVAGLMLLAAAVRADIDGFGDGSGFTLNGNAQASAADVPHATRRCPFLAARHAPRSPTGQRATPWSEIAPSRTPHLVSLRLEFP
jgi:hypothetical protein